MRKRASERERLQFQRQSFDNRSLVGKKDLSFASFLFFFFTCARTPRERASRASRARPARSRRRRRGRAIMVESFLVPLFLSFVLFFSPLCKICVSQPLRFFYIRAFLNRAPALSSLPRASPFFKPRCCPLPTPSSPPAPPRPASSGRPAAPARPPRAARTPPSPRPPLSPS